MITLDGRPGRARLWLLLLVVLAAVVDGSGLGRLPLWRDEAASVEIASRSVPRILAALGRIDVVHGCYYLLLHVVLLVGDSEVAVRLPSLVGAVAAVGLTAELARRRFGPAAGTAAAAVMICHPLLSFYAREARPYALGTAVVCAVAFVLFGGPGPVGRGRLAVVAGLTVLATWLHLFDALPIAGLLAGYLLTTRERPGWRPLLVGAGLVAVAVAPLAWLAAGQSAQVSWVQRPGPDAVRALAVDLAGTVPTAVAVAVVLVGAVLMGGAVTAAGPERGVLGAAALATVTGPAVLLAISWLGPPVYVERYVLAAAPMLALGVGAAVALLPRSRIVAVAMVLVALTGLPAAWTGPASKTEDLRAAAAALRGSARAGDCVAFSPGWSRVGLDHYLRPDPVLLDVALDPGPEPVGLFAVERPEPDVEAVLRGCTRVWVAGYPGPVGGWRPVPEVTTAALAAVAPEFTPAPPTRFDDFSLTLWVRHPDAPPAALLGVLSGSGD